MNKPKRSNVRNQRLKILREIISNDESSTLEVKSFLTIAEDLWADIRFVGTPSAGASEDFIDGQITGKIKIEAFCGYVPGVRFEDFILYKGGRYDIYSIQVTGNKKGLALRAELRDDNTYGPILNRHKDVDALFEANPGGLTATSFPHVYISGALYQQPHKLAFKDNIFSFEPIAFSVFRNPSTQYSYNLSIKCIEDPFLSTEISEALLTGSNPAYPKPKDSFYLETGETNLDQFPMLPNFPTNFALSDQVQNFGLFQQTPWVRDVDVNNIFVPYFSDQIEGQYNFYYENSNRPLFPKVLHRQVTGDDMTSFIGNTASYIQQAVKFDLPCSKSIIKIEPYTSELNGKRFPQIFFGANASFKNLNFSGRIPYGVTNGTLKLLLTPLVSVAGLPQESMIQKLIISNYEYARFVSSNSDYKFYFPTNQQIFAVPLPLESSADVQYDALTSDFVFTEVGDDYPTDPRGRIAELSVYKPTVDWIYEEYTEETEEGPVEVSVLEFCDILLELDGDVLDEIVSLFDATNVAVSKALNSTSSSNTPVFPFVPNPVIGSRGTISNKFSTEIPNVYPKDLKTELLEAFVGYKTLLGYTEPEDEGVEPEPILSEEVTYDIRKYVNSRPSNVSFEFKNIPTPTDAFGEFFLYFKLKTDLIEDLATEKVNLPHICMLKVPSPA